jgi:putative membrane protein
MRTASRILVVLVALEHIGILVLEMFFWDHPVGQRIFGMTPEISAASAVLAANQGLYNGFLAAGLFWGLLTRRHAVVIFFLVCVVTAGLFGGLTAKTSILFTQALPALAALILNACSEKRGRRVTAIGGVLICVAEKGVHSVILFFPVLLVPWSIG